MSDRTWIPVSRWVTSWPSGEIEAPALDDVGIVEFENSATDGALTASCTLAFATDLAFAVPGVEGLELLLLADGGDARVTVEAVLGAQLTVSLRELSAGVRLANDLLRPVTRASPSAPWEPVLEGDGSPAPLEAAFGADRVTVDGEGRLVIEPAPAIGLDPFMIGDTGIVVEATEVTLVMSDATPPPPGCSAGFRGVSIERAAVHLPDAFALDLAPDSIVATGLVIGTGGVSGQLTGTWSPEWSGTEASGDGAGTLAGLPFALESLSLELAGSSVVGASLAGRLAVPFFDALLDVDVTIAADGALGLAVRAADGVLADLSVPGLGSLAVAAIGLVSDDKGEGLLISGDLQPEVGAPAMTWPTVTLQDLRIGSDGTIEVPSGWITLQEPLALNLYGFGMEITRIGFGSEDDGRRWFGVDGSVRLTELLPAGASARGLRAIWDPERPSALPAIALDGIGVFFGIPDAFGFEGEVALIDDPNSDAKLFTGALSLGLDALDVGDRRRHHDRPRLRRDLRLRPPRRERPDPARRDRHRALRARGPVRDEHVAARDQRAGGARPDDDGRARRLVRLVPQRPRAVLGHRPVQVVAGHRGVGVRRRPEPRHAAGRRLHGQHQGAARRAPARAGDPAPGHGRHLQAPGRVRGRIQRGGHARAARRDRRPRRHAAARARRRMERPGAARHLRLDRGVLRLRPARRLASVARARRAREPAHPGRRSCRCSTPTAG